ncbi:uncharacterized protein CBL_10671 [Carabus blaptoides fortunei]
MAADMNTLRAVHLHLPESAPIDIEFKDVIYTVSLGRRKGNKQILKSVSGKFLSGELTAIMGPSGAGKSSLLNILTGFHNTGMSGIITSTGNNGGTGSQQYKKESCYILQDDRLAPLFTVEESMNLAANLKLGGLSPKAKQIVIDDILDTLGLIVHKNTRCERLSGGQKKRLSIALELVDNPPIMFLDEPTTGLDSSSSTQCIAMLKALARGGRTIVCTIHQPTATLYEMFDHVYVLAEGQCVYQGAAINTVPYLSSVGFHCPQYHNPADYLMEVANGDYGNFTSQLASAVNTSPGSWRQIRSGPNSNNGTSQIMVDNEKSNGTDHPVSKTMVLITPPSEWTKFGILLNRSVVKMYRDWTVTHLKLVLHLLVGILIGLNYLNAGNDGSKSFRNVGYLLITAAYLCYTSMMPAVLRFPQEVPVLKKERFNNWYCLKTYFLVYLVVDVPLQILYCTVYASVSYVMSAQPLDVTRFLMFLCTCVLVTLTAQSLGVLLGTTVNPINGTFLGSIITAVMLVLAGFFVLFAHMPRMFVWMSQLNFLRYGLAALVTAIYGNAREPLQCPDNVLYCHYRLPQTILDEFGMADRSYWFNCAMLSVFFVIFKFISYFTLRKQLKSG